MDNFRREMAVECKSRKIHQKFESENNHPKSPEEFFRFKNIPTLQENKDVEREMYNECDDK
jgi:hypothetical protein